MKLSQFWSLFGLCVLGVGMVGVLDWLTGYEVSVLPLYAMPVALAAWYLSGLAGFAVAFLCTVVSVWLNVQITPQINFSRPWIPYSNGLARFTMWAFVAFSVGYMRRTIDLANRKIQAFTGQIPICTDCGKLGAKDGTWLALPEYLREYTDGVPMQKVCPDCARVHFAGLPALAAKKVIHLSAPVEKAG